MIPNGTLLGVAPLKITILVVGLSMTLLFTLVEPEASAGLPIISRFVFWVIHIGVGLLGILCASYLVRNFYSRDMPAWLTIIVTGLLGALLLAPFYLALDTWFPSPEAEIPDSWLDEFATKGLAHAIVVEYLEIVPTFLALWWLVNIPLILNRTSLNTPPPEEPTDPDDPDQETNEDNEKEKQLLDQFYNDLPEAVGRDIVAISSDLHYLNVYTELGKTLILGALKDYVSALGEEGIQVHRSHWVSKRHVERTVISGENAYCLMTTGLKVPISRSKRKLVKDYFGQSQLSKQKPELTPKLTRVK